METIRGTVSHIQFAGMEGHTTRYADNYTSAAAVTFNVGGRPAMMPRAESFPPLNEGDEVEVSGIFNPNSGALEVHALHNQTTGVTWKLDNSHAVGW
jgi:hypothetical protein